VFCEILNFKLFIIRLMMMIVFYRNINVYIQSVITMMMEN